MKPAVDGTTNVLKACAHVGGVKRVVLTGSVLALCGFAGDSNKIYTEQDWVDPDAAETPYIKSKVLAERAAWEFVDTLPEDKKFDFTVLLPSYIIGPVLCGFMSVSMEIPKRLLMREMPLVPKLTFPTVDVRDVATAHVRALTSPDAVGSRNIISARNISLTEMARVIADEFAPMGYSVPTRAAPDFLLKIFAWFDKQASTITPALGHVIYVNSSRMTEVLEVKPRDIRESIVDMCYSMIELGFVKKTSEYKAKCKG